MFNRICNLPEKQSYFLFGPRQTGKTTLIESLLSPQDLTFNLLKNDLYFAYQKDPSLFRKEIEKKLKEFPDRKIFVDEVQRIPELLNEVHHLIEKYSCQFIMTGSSARKLKRGAANLLAGRAFARYLFPLTYEEMKDQYDLDQILQYGSLPKLFSFQDQERRDFLKVYTETYLKEEIQAEALVRNLGGYARFLEIVAGQCGEVVNFSSIGRDCALQTRTVQSYFEILEDTLLGFRLEPWRKSVRKRLLGHPKFYLFDTGVTNAINHRLQGDLGPVQKGKLFEQLIILETYRMLSYQLSETRIFYWRTNHGAEVDLVLEKNGEVFAGIEIKSSLEISRADLSGLRSLREEYPNAQMILVSKQPHSYPLDFATVLSFEDYMKWLKEIS